MGQVATDTAKSSFQNFLEQALQEKPALRLLEAGCGSASRLSFSHKQVHVTGIDISQKQLDRNLSLDEKIQADLQSYEYQPSSYDLIVCWDVLEHLPKPALALRGFALAVREGGLIILGGPNVLSLKGLVTKYTPYPVHVWFFKWLHGRHSSGGKDESHPFRTYHDYSARPGAIRQFAEKSGLQVVYFETNDVLDYDWFFSTGNTRARVVRATYRVLKALARILSLGALGDSDFLIVLQRPTSQPVRA